MKYISESLAYRTVEIEDAEFILSLRTNHNHKYLIAPLTLELQNKWIEEYKKRELLKIEYYFLFYENNERRGTYRIYNINKYSFTYGSWLFNDCQQKMYPIIADLEMGDFGFYSLKKEIMLFDVKKINKRVLNYHLMKKPLIYNEDKDNLYFLIQKDNWEIAKQKIRKLLGF